MNPETKKEGNGLGLYIVKYLMEAMGGSVRAEKCGRISGVSGTAHFSGEEKLKMADNKRILIVEDDADISMVEEAYLESAGFETKIIADGTQAAEMLEQEHFDLVLLDLMLPGKSGYEICREIRDSIDIPILMVTARTESIDKIRGLGLGADDYIAKPFDPAELVARVHANLRQYERLRKSAEQESKNEPEEIRIHDLRILVNSWKVYKGEREIKFPNREFEILKFFAMNPNIVFSKEQIFEKNMGI